jgi:hemerythrin HHE cation binding domain-containing protein
VTARISTSLLLPVLVALFGSSPAAGQEPAPGSRVAVLEAPLALRLEHKSLREAVNRALEDKAGVGDAARAIDALLSSHFKHEEELALRPLGLLRGIARDASSADVASAIVMTGKIEQDLPQLLDEHRAILEGSKRLGDAARRERKPQFLDIADRLWLHTRIAEEVLYPAAILLGEHLRVTPEAKRPRE